MSKHSNILHIRRRNNEVSVKMRKVTLLFGSLSLIQPLTEKVVEKNEHPPSHRGVES